MLLTSTFPVPQDTVAVPSNDSGHPLARNFRSFIENQNFPCVGAKSALANGRLVTIVVDDIRRNSQDIRIHTALLGFIAQYRNAPSLFQSFAVVFRQPHGLSEEEFEHFLWARVQALCDMDFDLGHPWDRRVASDPDNPHFSLSVAGEAFFVVGLHPMASRQARRFQSPVLVFNLHDQFERLRNDGRYEKMRTTILKRDESFSGSVNPMLSRHGVSSEARQYSGRVVKADWRCPFEHRTCKNAPPTGREK